MKKNHLKLYVAAAVIVATVVVISASHSGKKDKKEDSVKTINNAEIAGDDALFVIKENGKYGYIDRTGKVVIKPQFDRANDFSDGLAAVYLSGNRCYIDMTGKVVINIGPIEGESYIDEYGIECGFKDDLIQRPFSDGLAWVAIQDQQDKTICKNGYIDKTGKMVLENPQWGWCCEFENGIAYVMYGGTNKMAFIDKSGNNITGVLYNYNKIGRGFNEGLCPVEDEKNGKWGYMDRTGKMVIEPQFDYASYFSEGLAKAIKNGKYCFIDKTGNVVAEPQVQVESIQEGFYDGLVPVKKGGKLGYMDKTGKLVIETDIEFDDYCFHEGFVRIKKNGKYGFLDKTGKWAIAPQFDDAKDFKNGLAYVEKDGMCGYIDKSGKIVWKAKIN